jgi:predicted secreted hydrolase
VFWLAGALAVATIAGMVLRGGERRPAGRVQGALAVTTALGGDAAGFARAERPREFAFPADHGPHPDYRTEWWYYTGNLSGPDGRHLGFQLTFFRTALSAAPAPRQSAWGASQVYLAHFALTNTRATRFQAWSRTARGALGLAGAEGQPFRVWVDDWSAEGEGPDGLPMRLRAAAGDVAIDLALDGGKPVVLQGERGLSRKGGEPGNASFYYSLTRMPARGQVRLGGEIVPVAGLAWMDREWSTSALGPDVVGWDWFALQLDDERDLMYYRLRRRDGTADPWSGGSLVDAAGGVRPLARDDVRVEPRGAWTSPRSGVRYPSGWRMTVPSADLVLDIAPRLADQELDVGTRYWEGAVAARGTAGGRAVAGHGYVELVGYGEDVAAAVDRSLAEGRTRGVDSAR